jgi:two-component system chemotaxis response regulator CheB
MAENILTKKAVVIGGSAGSLRIILYILNHLRPGLSVPVIIVLHRKNDSDSGLVNLLNMGNKLIVKEADDKEPIVPGVVYVAPADYHLLIEKNQTFSLDASEKVQFSRPSIDVTFQTADDAFGKGLAGILLSGANNDGTEGFKDISHAGGVLIAQNPADAQIPLMPQSAIDTGLVDYVFDGSRIAAFINAMDESTLTH